MTFQRTLKSCTGHEEPFLLEDGIQCSFIGTRLSFSKNCGLRFFQHNRGSNKHADRAAEA